MSDKDILDLIKDKRHKAYCNYEFNLRLNMKDDNKLSFRARKEEINRLLVAIKVYDNLIDTIQSLI